MCGGPQEKGLPHSGLPNEDELASEGDGRRRPVGDRASNHEGLQEGGGGKEQGRGSWRGQRGRAQGPEDNAVAGKQEARRALRREGRGRDPGGGGRPFQMRMCHQRDRRSARAPQPEVGVGAAWEC